MIRRPVELIVSVGICGAVAAHYTASPWWTLAGAVAGSGLWVTWDNLRAAKALRWVRGDRSGEPPELPGAWGAMVERSAKVFKSLTRQAERNEERLEEFLAAIQASPNGVVVLDQAEAIEWCNQLAAEHFGFDPARDVRQNIRNLVRDPAFIAYLKAGNFGHSVEVAGRASQPGQLQKLSVQIHPYGQGRKLMLSRDVTALELAEAMRRDFVANVSHEIRTPLTVLSGFVETLLSLDLTAEERHRYLSLMSQQAGRMQTLVSDLLTLSRLEGSPAPGATDWMDASELLEHVLSEARALSAVVAGGAHEIVSDGGPSFRVAGARSELVSAMSNLLSNAVRYTPAGGCIRAGWRLRGDGSAEFHVGDTGPGIAAEHLPRLTERFYRVDRSRSRETGGTGLGLAIVKHVVQRHGGQLRIDSTVGKGSTFFMTLPAGRVHPL